MDRRSPVDHYTGKHYDAFANWVMSWRYHYRVSAGKCRFTSASVLVELKYTYPRWLRSQSVSPSLVSAWRHYLKVLHKHENGHGAIAIRVGGEVLSSIRMLAPRRSCQKLAAAADQMGANGIERTNRLQKAYDDRTDHGATQGARFP